MNHRTTVRRLLTLALHLETNVARKDFNIRFWSCGTAGCAVGHACRIPSFRRAGLRLVPWASTHTPSYLASTGIAAAALFFGIERSDANQLFMDWAYMHVRTVTPKMVARRIRKLVKRLNDDLAREKAKVADDKPCRKPRLKFRRLPTMEMAMA